MALVKTSFVTSMMALLAWSGLSSAQGVPAAAPAPAAPVAAAPAAAAPAAPVAAPAGDPAKPDIGEVGAFVIDQVSGFRGRVGGGVGFYGPIGLAYNTFEGQSGTSLNWADPTKPTASSTQTTINSWSLFLAPSIDYFIAPNVSVGGLFAFDTTFGSSQSKTTKQTSGGTVIEQGPEQDLPTVRSFTLMPRVGYLIRMDTRLSFWPRLGVGYFSGSNVIVGSEVDQRNTPLDPTDDKTVTVARTANISSLLFQLDLGVIYQITDNVFFRVAPAIAFSYDGSSKVTYKGDGVNIPAQEGSGKAFQFELTSGFGANFSL